jgi:hypothetical protein
MSSRKIAPLLFALVWALAPAAWTEDYTGPRPPKPDMVYLVHADNLIPLETGDAQQDSKKKETTYVVPGESSPARTPLAEPIFIMQSDKVSPQSLQLFRFDVKNGRRELKMSEGRRGGPRAYILQVTRLDRDLYRIEAEETLEDGEYVLSPTGSNRVYCFEEY